MFCKSCGKKIDYDSQFCSYCGTKQSEKNKPSSGSYSPPKDEIKIEDLTPSFDTQNSSKSNHKHVLPSIEPEYDSTYLKETDATYVGVLILTSSLLLLIFNPFIFDDIESYNQFRTMSSIGSLVLRIFITNWVVNIAKRQNRETFGWGLFAFLLPSIALVIIGQQKKIFAKLSIDNKLTDQENSLVLVKKAQNFLDDRKYNECIRFAEKALALNQENTKASEVIMTALLKIPIDEVPNKLTQVVYRETKENKLLKIVSENYQSTGASVFINDEKAPDGEYNYLNDGRKLTVKNGKLEKITY